MRKLTTLLISLCCLLTSLEMKAQSNCFYNLNEVEGLNLNTVRSLYQDERHYIWIGTQTGAGVYHGGELTFFKHDKTDSGTLPNNEIKQIKGDGKGHVYFRTGDKSIVRYDILTDTFTTILSNAANYIHYDDGLYYSTTSEVYRFDEKTGTSEQLYAFKNMDLIISAIYVHENRIYIGTYGNGIYILENNNLRQIASEGYIHDIFKDSRGLFWFTSVYGDGVYVLDGDKLTNYRCIESDPTTLSSDKTHRCCEDHDGNIWIGSFNGLNRFNRETGTFTRFTGPDFEENSITDVICDHQGTIWASSYYFGVWFFNPARQNFRRWSKAYYEAEGLSSAVISRMIEDDEQRLWIGTSKGGLNCYDLKADRFKWYRKTGRWNEISSENIKALYFDRQRNCLWIGTHLGGMDRLNLSSGNFLHYTHNPRNSRSLPSNIVSDIVPYKDDLILATKGCISRFNPSSGTCSPLFKNENYSKITGYCSQLLVDHKGRLWMAHTSSGAFCYDLEAETMMIFSNEDNVAGGISSGRVNHLYEDSQGRIWLCNNQNGLDLYDEEKGAFVNFDVKNTGIISNTVYAICEMKENQYILTTDEGYTLFDYASGRAQNFVNNQNSPLSSATEKCLLKASDGNIYIGGMNGIVSFGGNSLEKMERTYDIRPYRLCVDGEDIRPGDGSGLLETDLSHTSAIQLKPVVNSMVLEYAVTDYLPYDRDRILYRLEGYTSTWSVLPANREISFTRLPPGKYTLVVKNETPEGTVGEESRLSIIVKTPFYKTVWAILLYLFLAGILIWIILKTYFNRVRLQETVRYEQAETRRIQELNQYKLSFFTNISHEFRTPLTIIAAQIEMLMEKSNFDKQTWSSLNRIYKNCILLKDLISELLEFRKQEQGYLQLKVQERNIVSYVGDLFVNFQSYAKRKQITYKFFKIYDNIPVWFDPKQLQKAINNLIFNAFRYVEEGGRITVSINKDSKQVMIDVINTGHGIKQEDLDKIFDRFYQTDMSATGRDASHAGTGIGLALAKGIIELHGGRIEVTSEIGKETMFRIILPLGKEHYRPEQILTEEPVKEEGMPQSSKDHVLLLQNEEEIQEPAAERIGEEADGRGTILVVEDSNPLRETLIQLFSPFYNVLSASEGDQALELARKVIPDLIISDVMVPNLSGLELCRKLKGEEETALIPFVLLSSQSDDQQIIEGYKFGADDYIVKPFNSKLLISRCNNLVNSRLFLREKYVQVKTGAAQQLLASSEGEKNFLQKATDIVKHHIEDNNFNIEVLARELGVSRTKLFTRLKDILGVTPLEFIMNIKIDEAAKMLKGNLELNISEISDRSGFSSPKYFRKYFKKKYGMTPQEFRNS